MASTFRRRRRSPSRKSVSPPSPMRRSRLQSDRGNAANQAPMSARETLSGDDARNVTSTANLNGKLRTSRAPVQALDLINQCHTRNRTARLERHLEGIAFALRRYRDAHAKRCLRIVGSGRKHEKRPPRRLLAATLRIERKPYDVADIRNVTCYQRSLPIGSSKVGSCMFPVVMRSMRSDSLPGGVFRT